MITFTRRSPPRTKVLDLHSSIDRAVLKKGADKPEDCVRGVFGRSECLIDLFEAQVAAKPGSDALVTNSQRLTYGEMNDRANGLAHYLRTLGIGREVLVGIFLDRSAEMVIALLGVLKAGAAYLPLDPSYPQDRIALILADARVQTVVTQSSLRKKLESLGTKTGQSPRLVMFDSADAIRHANKENLSPSASANDLAYVIYTSGSTGKPKGVALEHRNAVALIRWAGNIYSFRELDGVLAGISICFDPSILDIFMPLCLGGKIVLAPNTLSLRELKASEEVRMITTVPSVMKELLRIGGIPSSLETINLGGEPLSTQLVNELYALPHVKRVYDLYGPTETTTCSTFSLRTVGGPATIGHPIDGTAVYLLNENLEPVPSGMTGELFIGGGGVARGYLNRPELTAERFIQHSLTDEGARLYRTGDRCRYRPDGNLEFLGRVDQQVKIRGFRIELGEVESALLTLPEVSEAIVAAREDETGALRLVAYVVRRERNQQGGPLRLATQQHLVLQMRAHLKRILPESMLPGRFVIVDHFERDLSGKVSRATLPDPPRIGASNGTYREPGTETEILLVRIWSKLLGLAEVGVNDDFFQLGGDSLLGVAMIAEIEKRTGFKLPVDVMLRAPTVGQLAVFLDGAGCSLREASDSIWVEIQPLGSGPRLFLVHGVGGGMLWGYANLARHLGKDQPVYAFKAHGKNRMEELDTIEKVAAAYVDALRRFQPEGPYALGGYCYGGNVAYEMARLLEQQGQEVALLAMMNASPPNSSYDRVEWSLGYLTRFLLNLGHWARGFFQWGPLKQWRFLRWKLSSLKKRLMRWIYPRNHPAFHPSVDELVDLATVPNDQRYLWALHVRALNNHNPKPYGGKVTLLRTRGHPFSCSYDPICGWGGFARGGVTLKLLPGLHESLLEEPHVGALARELKVLLDGARVRKGARS